MVNQLCGMIKVSLVNVSSEQAKWGQLQQKQRNSQSKEFLLLLLLLLWGGRWDDCASLLVELTVETQLLPGLAHCFFGGMQMVHCQKEWVFAVEVACDWCSLALRWCHSRQWCEWCCGLLCEVWSSGTTGFMPGWSKPGAWLSPCFVSLWKVSVVNDGWLGWLCCEEWLWLLVLVVCHELMLLFAGHCY